MQPDTLYLKYYIAIFISIAVLKGIFVILNRMAKSRLELPSRFFLATLVFSYTGLSVGIFIGITGQAAITIAVLAVLSFCYGSIALIFFTDKHDTPYNRKMATYSLVLITLALAIGSGAGADHRKIPEAVDNKPILSQPEIKTEKNNMGVKGKESEATVFNGKK